MEHAFDAIRDFLVSVGGQDVLSLLYLLARRSVLARWNNGNARWNNSCPLTRAAVEGRISCSYVEKESLPGTIGGARKETS